MQVAPWAQDIVTQILQEPLGDWFMSVTVGLEYMYSKPLGAEDRAPADDEEDTDDDRHERRDSNHTEDDDAEEAEARAREEAGNDWMVQQGFDRKE